MKPASAPSASETSSPKRSHPKRARPAAAIERDAAKAAMQSDADAQSQDRAMATQSLTRHCAALFFRVQIETHAPASECLLALASTLESLDSAIVATAALRVRLRQSQRPA